jgi:hypothetical protein
MSFQPVNIGLLLNPRHSFAFENDEKYAALAKCHHSDKRAPGL